MAPPKLTPFTEAQIKVVVSRLPEVFLLLDAQKPASEIRKWNTATTSNVLKEAVFGADIPEDDAWDPSSDRIGMVSGLNDELISMETAYSVSLVYMSCTW
jgi:hypothetical protein